MRRPLPALLASLAVAAAWWSAPRPAGAQTAAPVQVETAAPQATSVPAAPPASPAPNAPAEPPAGPPPCAARDLALREIAAKTGGAPSTMWVYAVKNRGRAACRLVGNAGIRLLDARGEEIPLRFAVRTMMAMLLTLPPGGEASFTVSYLPPRPDTAASCVKGARIEVFFPTLSPLSAKSSMAGCNGSLVRVSNLQFGVAALTPPESDPSALVL